MDESNNPKTTPDAAPEEFDALAPTPQSYTNAAVLATETTVPLTQDPELTATSIRTIARETYEQTRQMRSIGATLKFIAFGMMLISSAIIVGVVYLMRDILALVVVSFLIAYILAPIVNMLEHRGLNRTLVVILVTLLILSGLAVLSTIAVSSVADQVLNLSRDVQKPETRELVADILAERLDNLPEFLRKPLIGYLTKREAAERAVAGLNIEQTEEPIESTEPLDITVIDPEVEISEDVAIDREQVLRMVTVLQKKLAGYIVGESRQIFSAVGSSAKGAFSLFTTSIIVLFLTFFMLNGGPQMKKAFIRMVPNRFFEPILVLTNGLDQQLGDYLRSRLVETVALSVLFGVGYWVLGLRFVILLGIVAGLANLIPYIGPFIGAIPALVVVFLGSRFGIGWSLLGVLTLTLIGQMVDNAVIFPLVVGKSVELGPVTTIVVVLVGEQLLGLIGLLIAVPIAAMLKLIFEEVYTQFRGYSRSIVHGH